MNQSELLLAMDTADGLLALYRDQADATRNQYRVMLMDQTPQILYTDHDGIGTRRDSGWLEGWPAAMERLGQYPWPHYECRYVQPAVAAMIWAELQNYVDRTGNSPIPSAWGRWRRACAQG